MCVYTYIIYIYSMHTYILTYVNTYIYACICIEVGLLIVYSIQFVNYQSGNHMYMINKMDPAYIYM